MARGRFIHGFSLVELMTAVGIMGILVSLALPRYRLFVARSRMSEAKTNLGIIYGLRQSYKAEFESWGSISGGMGCPDKCNSGSPGSEAKNELGFRVTDCAALRYKYTTMAASAHSVATSDGAHTQCQVYHECDKDDVWEIFGSRKLNHNQSAIKECYN